MPAFARGSEAFGYCDRCHRRAPLRELKMQIINRVPSGLRVCEPCLDIDHEQLQIGRAARAEPMALRDPRPDTALLASRGMYGWRPLAGVAVTASAGSLLPQLN